jgi:hypothetical protein
MDRLALRPRGGSLSIADNVYMCVCVCVYSICVCILLDDDLWSKDEAHARQDPSRSIILSGSGARRSYVSGTGTARALVRNRLGRSIGTSKI